MNRKTTWSLVAATALVGTLAGCDLYGPPVDVRPALAINGKPVPTDAARQYELGKSYLAQRRFAPAAQAFQSALLAGGPSVEVLNALAVAYDNLGRYDLSEEMYRRALALDARNAQTLNNYGVSLARRGMPDRAKLVLAQAHADAPSDAMVAANIARLQSAEQAVRLPAKRPVASVDLAPPKAPSLPRVEHVGVDKLELITRPENDRAAEAGYRAPARRAAAVPPAHVSIETAAAPSAVTQVTSVADTAVKAVRPDRPKAKVAEKSIRALHPRIEVANGAGRDRMAARMRSFLKTHGVPVRWITNDRSFHHPKTVIWYRPGFESAARELARSLPVRVALAESTSVRGDIRLCLGRDLMRFDLALQTGGKKHDV